MEKLVDLLNEYEKEKCWRVKDGKLHNTYYCDYDQEDEENRVVSKNFGFIKWLVENDKVDKYNEDLCSLMSELSEFQQYEKCLLMLLAIQDSPIEYLISILR